jgi:F0F1-type ATP synthase membrane subunit b/b'
MSATFWVSLSTIVFLGIVALKSYKAVVVYFTKQQEEIKQKLADASQLYQNAQNLYDEYSKRIEALEVETGVILDNARHESQKIIDGTQQAVSKILEKKNKELSRRIFEYETQAKNHILSKYADMIANDLYEKVH